jgi:hypothetical protein
LVLQVPAGTIIPNWPIGVTRKILADYLIYLPMTDARSVRLSFYACQNQPDERPESRPGLTAERLVVIIHCRSRIRAIGGFLDIGSRE